MIRKTLVTMVMVVGSFAAAGPAVASAQEGGSFDGCPVLSEARSTGSCVARLQNALNTVNDDYGLTVTRTFDAPTRIAVLDFQGRNGLGADGIVGAATAGELQRQALAQGSVASPRPGAARTPADRCRELGEYVPHGDDECVPQEGAVATGKSPAACTQEAAERLRKRIFEQAKKDGDSDEAAKKKARDARLSKKDIVLEAGKILKCTFWDIDGELKEKYKPKPMPR